VEGYGLSEATPVTHANPVFGRRKLGTIGLPYPDTDIKIMDKETGTRELPPLPFAVAETGGLTKEQSEQAEAYTGELVIKGPQIMKGYLNRPDESAATVRDGWLYTGDIACLDAEGYTIIRDRAKDMIKFKAMRSSRLKWRTCSTSIPTSAELRSSACLTRRWEKWSKPSWSGSCEKGQIKPGRHPGVAKDKMTHYKIPSSLNSG